MTRSELRSSIKGIICHSESSDIEKALWISMRLGDFVRSEPKLTRDQEAALVSAISFSGGSPMQNFARVGWALAVLGEDEP